MSFLKSTILRCLDNTVWAGNKNETTVLSTCIIRKNFNFCLTQFLVSCILVNTWRDEMYTNGNTLGVS